MNTTQKDQKQKPTLRLFASARAVVRQLRHSTHRATRRTRVLAWSIVVIAVGLAGLVAYIVVATKQTTPSRAVLQENKLAVAQVMSANESFTTSLKRVSSSLGFSLAADQNQMTVRAQTTSPDSTAAYVHGEDFSGDEVFTKRAYSLIKVTLKTPDETQGINRNPELSVLTNIRNSYWQTRGVQAASAEEKLRYLIEQDEKTYYKAADGYTSTPAEDITINGVVFKKKEYVFSYSAGDLLMTLTTHRYYTVQNDRPYFATIYPADQQNADKVHVLEGVLGTVQFDNFDGTQLSVDDPSQPSVGGVNDDVLNDEVSNTPYDINADTIFDVILKNQPAVVRIATVRCADIALTGGVVWKNVCGAAVGSGSIISEDGYVATNSHVVFIDDASVLLSYFVNVDSLAQYRERLASGLTYLVTQNVITANEKAAIEQRVASGALDPSSVAQGVTKILASKVTAFQDDASSYGVQLGREPLRVDMGDDNKRMAIQSGSTIKLAKRIAYDYDQSILGIKTSEAQKSGSSDVAILKIDGTYPIVRLGSIEKMKTGDDLTAIGFPAFIDNGLLTKQKTTKPTITQGQVVEIGKESLAKSNELIFTTVPIAQGNSGGPAFDAQGLQVGLNTYAKLLCKDLNCFGKGIARDVKDLQSLLSSESIKLDTSSKLNEQWAAAQADYARGYYRGAVRGYQAIVAAYPAHYLAQRMKTVAESKYGTPSDISSKIERKQLLIKVAVGAGLLLLVAVAMLVSHLLRGSRHPGTGQFTPAPPQSGGAPMGPSVVMPPQTYAVAAPAQAAFVQSSQPLSQPQAVPPQMAWPAQTPVQVVPPSPMPAAQVQTPQIIQPQSSDIPLRPQQPPQA